MIRWALFFALIVATGCGDDPDVYSLDGGSGGAGGQVEDSGSDGD
jgi:hypothetical protein